MSQPAARDFQPPSRARTSVVRSPPPEQPPSTEQHGSNVHRHRRYTVNNAATPASLDAAVESPAEDRGRVSFESLRRRPTRSNTIRKYRSPTREHWEEPGAEPGIDTTQGEEEPPSYFSHLKQECDITVVDFSDEQISQHALDNGTLQQFLDMPKEPWVSCRWINVNGLSWDVIKTLGNDKSLHRLAIEDLMNTRGRTKVDWYSDHAFSKLMIEVVTPRLIVLC